MRFQEGTRSDRKRAVDFNCARQVYSETLSRRPAAGTISLQRRRTVSRESQPATASRRCDGAGLSVDGQVSRQGKRDGKQVKESKSRVKESETESKSRKASLASRKARRKASQGKQVSRQGKRDATVNVRTQEAIAVLAVSRQGERDQAQHQAQHGFGSSRKARPSSILTRSMVLILPRLSRDQLPAVARQVCRSRDAEDNKTIPAVWCHLVLLSIVLVLRGCLAARLSHCPWRWSC